MDIYGTSGNDYGEKKLVGTNQDDNIYGYEGSDLLEGRGGDDDLLGAEGDDYLFGGSGADYLDGDAGNDMMVGGSGADFLRGGAGIDVANYTESNAGVQVSMLANAVGTGGTAEGDTFSGVEIVWGSAFDDTITGDSAANQFSGGTGNDVLNGGIGTDTLIGGVGNDTLQGGMNADLLMGDQGIDTASYAGSNDHVYVDLSTNSTLFGHAQGDSLTGIENLVGSAFGDYLHGTAGANRLDGGSGDDLLNGDAGADVFVGGQGMDSVSYLGSGAVTVNLATGQASGSHAAGDTFSSIEGITGSHKNDKITGDGGANTLYGNLGLDELAGGGGADLLDGGRGVDKLTGGSGADTFEWSWLDESPAVSLGWDRITDFSHAQGDKMDLSGLEDLDNATYRGWGQFTGEDQVRHYVDNGLTFVEVNVDADLGADLRFYMDGVNSLVASDFML